MFAVIGNNSNMESNREFKPYMMLLSLVTRLQVITGVLEDTILANGNFLCIFAMP